MFQRMQNGQYTSRDVDLRVDLRELRTIHDQQSDAECPTNLAHALRMSSLLILCDSSARDHAVLPNVVTAQPAASLWEVGQV